MQSKMLINDIKEDSTNVNVVGRVIAKDSQTKEFQKQGQKIRVCSVVVEDDSGSIHLNLWNDDIERIRVGDFVHIKNAYVKTFQQIMSLNIGKFGKIEIVEDKNGNTKI